jgi:integrase
MSVEAKLDILIELLTKQQKSTSEECRYTVGKWADEWLTTYKQGKLRPLTYEKYKGINENYIKPRFGAIPLDKLNAIDVQKTLNSIEFPREREHIFAQLKSMYLKAVQLQLITYNPILSVELPRHRKAESKALTIEQQKTFLKACHNDKYGDMFIFCLFAGLRRGEALALTDKAIDLKARKIAVTASYNRGKCHETKTEAGMREVPIFDNLLPYAQKYAGTKDKRLFAINEANAYRHMKNILEKCGMSDKGITIHSLRHTFITRCYENGLDPKTLSKWVGHTTPTMTMNVYTHCNKDFENTQIENLNRRLKDTLIKENSETL